MHRLAILAALLAAPATAQETLASADLTTRDGENAGRVEVASTPSGVMLITLDLTGVPEGTHGVHIHETGDCSADDFSSAGGHLAGDAQHGVLVEGGPHPGDLPNIHSTGDGTMRVEFFNERLTQEMLLDDDGSAFIMHEGEDDYESQPAGNAGNRIACGVFEPAG